ncbi:hypothetical protein PVAND_005096 [Polypedilum vanderplanki]|uniref:Uncharacterized protein n=1 Tax=Polypedilum vanderplanki TaxID=319348 RepID=A0A9J6C028_POLVA|nr:hypothetical protein PVAND_005096 [Polypedilum vanderplanki]
MNCKLQRLYAEDLREAEEEEYRRDPDWEESRPTSRLKGKAVQKSRDASKNQSRSTRSRQRTSSAASGNRKTSNGRSRIRIKPVRMAKSGPINSQKEIKDEKK